MIAFAFEYVQMVSHEVVKNFAAHRIIVTVALKASMCERDRAFSMHPAKGRDRVAHSLAKCVEFPCMTLFRVCSTFSQLFRFNEIPLPKLFRHQSRTPIPLTPTDESPV